MKTENENHELAAIVFALASRRRRRDRLILTCKVELRNKRNWRATLVLEEAHAKPKLEGGRLAGVSGA